MIYDPNCMADGGEVDDHDDDDMMMDQVATECMDAIERKDKDAFIESLHVLLGDLLNKMSSPAEEEDKPAKKKKRKKSK